MPSKDTQLNDFERIHTSVRTSFFFFLTHHANKFFWDVQDPAVFDSSAVRAESPLSKFSHFVTIKRTSKINKKAAGHVFVLTWVPLLHCESFLQEFILSWRQRQHKADTQIPTSSQLCPILITSKKSNMYSMMNSEE